VVSPAALRGGAARHMFPRWQIFRAATGRLARDIGLQAIAIVEEIGISDPTIKTGLPPQLSHAQLVEDRTLATARRRFTLAARGLFRLLDVIYGRERSRGKFKLLEVIARVPYQA